MLNPARSLTNWRICKVHSSKFIHQLKQSYTLISPYIAQSQKLANRGRKNDFKFKLSLISKSFSFSNSGKELTNILPSASSVLSFTPPWWFFVVKTAPGNSSQLKISSTLRCLVDHKHLWSETALVFFSSPPEIQVCVKPCCNLL